MTKTTKHGGSLYYKCVMKLFKSLAGQARYIFRK